MYILFFFQLFQARAQVEIEDEEEKRLWESVTVYCMFDEETDDDGGTRKSFKTVPWRSDKLQDIIERMDVALGVRRFYNGKSNRPVDFKKVPAHLVAPEFLVAQ